MIVPHLRGHGPTRFVDVATPRSGQQAALGGDVIDLMDALGSRRAVLAGYDWGGRAACVVAALWPERVTGIVSVNGYLIQDITRRCRPSAPTRGRALVLLLLPDRARAGRADANRREIAEVIWRRNSPAWRFDDATLDRAAEAFDNPDYVDVVIHSYRHRLGLARRAPPLRRPRAALAALPPDHRAGGHAGRPRRRQLPGNGRPPSAAHFTGPRAHHHVPEAGHNLPQEAPEAFAAAVHEVAELATRQDRA